MNITDKLTEVQIREMEIEVLKERLRYVERENKKLNEQLRLGVVGSSLPTEKEKNIEIKRLIDKYYEDNYIVRSAFGLGFSTGVDWCKEKIKR